MFSIKNTGIMRDWSFRYKMIFLTSVFTIGILFSNFIGFSNIGKLKSDLDEVALIHLKSVYFLLELDKDLYQASGGVQKMVSAQPGSDEFLEGKAYYRKQVLEDVPEKWQEGFLTLKSDWSAEESSLIKSFETAHAAWKEAIEYGISETEQNRANPAEMELLFQRISGPLFDAMRDPLNEISDATADKTDAKIVKSDLGIRQAKFMLTLTTIVTLAVSVGLAWLILILMLTPIQQVINGLEEISSGKSDLNSRLSVNSGDEVGTLVSRFNGFMEKLQIDGDNKLEIQHGVSSGTDELNSIVSELSIISNSLFDKSSEISDQTNIVVSSSNEMSANMETVSNTSQATRGNMESIAVATKEMSATVSEIAQNAEQARGITSEAVSNVREATTSVDELGVAANEISKVTDTIIEIAEQTKLLALNATIEAARAGEAGKGFAVVANEVKELAKQTNDATADISQKINAIQTGTNSTVEKISSISAVIDRVSEIVNTIATAVEEQNVTTQDIASNIGLASQGVNEVVDNVAHATTVSKDISTNLSSVHLNIDTIKQTGKKLLDASSLLSDTGQNLNEMAHRLDS